MAHSTFTLTGKHTSPSGAAHVGTVKVTPNAVIRDVAGAVVMAGPDIVKLDATGAWSLVLPCDSPGLNPATGIGFTVEYLFRAESLEPQSFYATADLAGLTVDAAGLVTTTVARAVTTTIGPQLGTDTDGVPYLLPGAPGTVAADKRLVTEADGDGRYSRRFDTTVIRQKPLRVFSSDFEEVTPGSGTLRDWTPGHTGTATHTIAASTRQDGGNTVTLVPAASSLALIKSKPVHGYANRPQWFTTDELTVPTSRTATFELQNASSLRLATIIVNAGGAGTVQINANDGLGAQLVPNVSTAIGFTSTTAFRLGIWYDPRSGKARFYLFCGSGAGVRHIYMGERTNTTGPFPVQYVVLNSGTAATGPVTAARVEAFEVRGVLHGCSVDLPNNGWDTSPAYFPTQSRYNSAADALALRLWGQREGIVNMAHGGWTVEQMENGGLSANGEDTATWANLVTALRPQFVVLGSGINSVAAAAQLAPPSTAATNALEASKAAYRRLIDASLAAGVAFVVVRNCSPVGGHVSFPTSAQLDLVDDWNAWVATLPSLYPRRVVVSDVWAATVDPATPRTLLPAYDVGDHIHYTVRGCEALADADAAAVLDAH